MTDTTTDPTPTHDEDRPEGVSRRMVLGVSAGAVGAGVIATTMANDGFGDPIHEAVAHGTGDADDAYAASDVVYTMCMNCNTYCSIKVRLSPPGDSGATALVRKVAGNPYSPLTTQPEGGIPYATSPDDAVRGIGNMSVDAKSRSGGLACLKGQAGPQIVHDAMRLRHPLRRVGERGSDRWESITWEEALSDILDGSLALGTPGLRSWWKFAPKKKVMADVASVEAGTMTPAAFESAWGDSLIDVARPELGPKSNLFAVIGGDRMNLMGSRFALQSLGSINQFNHGGTCGMSGVVANARSHPTTGFQRMYADIDYCKYLIVWGAEPVTANKGPTWLAPRIGRARELGMKMTVIDPRMSKTGEKADTWVPVRPGYDGDLAWGLIRWIIENERYDDAYLRATGAKAAAAIGEPNFSDATHLVKIDDPKRGKLTMVDLGLAEKVIDPDTGKPADAESVARVDGTLVGVDANEAPAADLDWTGEVETPGGPVKVATVFHLLAARAMERDIADYAEAAGTTVDVVETIARDFTSHGKQAAVMSYRGAAMRSNGFDTIRAIGYLNFLIGNHDWKGGAIGAQKGYSPNSGRYELIDVEKPNKAWGVPITREKSKYEESSFFKDDGYPSKRRWYQFPGNMCHEVIPSAAVGYPYHLNALFLHRHSPLNSSPTGHRIAEQMHDTDAIKLIVAFDVIVGDSGAHADYVLPEPTYLERFTQETVYPSQQYAVQQLGQPTTLAFEGPRPVEWFYLELAKAMELPGVGDNGFGPGIAFNTVEDYWIKMAANVAYAGENPVPDASPDELRLFTQTRQKHLGKHFDENVWKAAVTEEEWRKVVYVLNRGGRFEEQGKDHEGGYEGDWLKYRYGGLCQFYDPKVAAAKDTVTGEQFEGIAVIRGMSLSNNVPVPRDGLPLHFINWKSRSQGTHRTVNSAWLREIRSQNFLAINPVDAEPRGIRTGDRVRVRSGSGQVEGVAQLTQAIRPGVVGADATMGHTHYGSRSITIDGEATPVAPAYGNKSVQRSRVPGQEELGFADSRQVGMAVNDLLADDVLLGGGGASDPIGGGASQLDTWVEVDRL